MFRLRHHLPERRRHGREQGQVLVVFALAMVAMLAMAGLLIDSGLAWGNRRQAQTAADTAALAAMKAMADTPVPDPYVELTWTTAATAAATTAGNSMAAANGFPSGTVSCPGGASAPGVVVNHPPLTGPHTFVNDPDHYLEYVEIITTRAMRTTFSGIVGQSCWLVSARAVARVVKTTATVPGTPFPAILAAGTVPGTPGLDCSHAKTAYHNSGSFHVIGDVISNSGNQDSSTGTVYDDTPTYVANPPNTCGSSTASVGTQKWARKRLT